MNYMAFLQDMLPHTMIVKSVTIDGRGDTVSSGSPVSVKCKVEHKSELVQLSSGVRVATNTIVITGGVYGLTTDTHRYTLPAEFGVPADSEAKMVEPVSDETGVIYEIVRF